MSRGDLTVRECVEMCARGRAEVLGRGSDRSWTVFRKAPWYDPRDGKPRVSAESL